MKRPRIIMAGIGLAALATGGGVTAASASGAPAAGTMSAASGTVAVPSDVNGRQVTYNGHPLYRFADDHADQVTGQGVQGFLVATPGVAPIAKSGGSTRSAPVVPSRGYGY
jgi:Secreted repeat of unknown function